MLYLWSDSVHSNVACMFAYLSFFSRWFYICVSVVNIFCLLCSLMGRVPEITINAIFRPHWQERHLRRVNHQSHMGLIELYALHPKEKVWG